MIKIPFINEFCFLWDNIFLKKAQDGNLWLQPISQDWVRNPQTTLDVSTERTYRALLNRCWRQIKWNTESSCRKAAPIYWAGETKRRIGVCQSPEACWSNPKDLGIRDQRRTHHSAGLGTSEKAGWGCFGKCWKSLKNWEKCNAEEKVHTGASPPRKARKQKDANTLSSPLSLHLFSSTLICGTW